MQGFVLRFSRFAYALSEGTGSKLQAVLLGREYPAFPCRALREPLRVPDGRGPSMTASPIDPDFGYALHMCGVPRVR